MSRLLRGVAWLGVVPVALWLAGLYAEDAARVAFVVLVLAGVVARWSSRSVIPFPSSPALNRTVELAIFAVPLIVGAHQAARVLSGRQGVDFAIFAQCTHAIAKTGVPTTSLLGLGPSNFLLHHFAPVLYVPGVISWLGVPAPFALVLVHAGSFGVALWGLHRFCTTVGLPREVAALWTLAVSLTPSIRPEILWGVHDEVFSLPLLAWAFVSLVRKRYLLSLALAAACLVTKESFAALGLAWLALLFGVSRQSGWRPSRSQLAALVVLSLLPAAGGASYVLGQPIWAGKPFDHLDRVGSVFPSLDVAGEKLLFLAGFFVAFVGLPLRSPRARLFCLPALPFIVLGLIASDAELYRFTGYHSIVPQFILAFAAALGLKDAPFATRTAGLTWAAVLSLQLTWKSHGLWRPAREAVAHAWYPAAELQAVPRDAVVAVDPAGALALIDYPHTIRLYAANERGARPDWVVARPDGWESAAPPLIADMRPYEAGPWLVFRR